MKPRSDAPEGDRAASEGIPSGHALIYPPVESRPEAVEFGAGAVRYEDPFRWLEDDADSDVITWQSAQDHFACTHLTNLPRYEEFLSTLQSIGESEDVILPMFAGNRYIRRFVPNDQDLAVVELSDTPTGPGRRVVDLNALRVDEPLQMAAYALSNSGSMAIVAYTAGGRERPVVQLVEVETGKVLSQGLPSERLSTFTWLPDDSGFFYMSMDPPDIRAGQTLFRVMLDHPTQATLEPVEPSHFYVRPMVAADRRHVLLFVNHLAPRPEFILDTQGTGLWKPFLKDVEGIFRGDIVGDRFFAITDDGDSGGRLVSIPLSTPSQRDTWQEVIPPSDAVLANILAVGDRAVVLDFIDTYSRLRVFNQSGRLEGEIELPGRGLVNRTGSFFSFFNVTNTIVRGRDDQIDFLFATPTTSGSAAAVPSPPGAGTASAAIRPAFTPPVRRAGRRSEPR